MFVRLRNFYDSLLENDKARYLIKEWIEPIFIALILALFIKTYFIAAFKIPSGSMRETLIEGDRILVSKCTYWFREPERGDVMVFRYPQDRKRDFIKRLIALPNDRVMLENGNVYINGEQLTDPEIIQQTYYYTDDSFYFGREGQEFVVPEDQYFVLGDNSGNSKDSRYWGFVPKSDIVGNALVIYWPLTRLRIIE